MLFAQFTSVNEFGILQGRHYNPVVALLRQGTQGQIPAQAAWIRQSLCGRCIGARQRRGGPKHRAGSWMRYFEVSRLGCHAELQIYQVILACYEGFKLNIYIAFIFVPNWTCRYTSSGQGTVALFFVFQQSPAGRDLSVRRAAELPIGNLLERSRSRTKEQRYSSDKT